MPDLPISDVLGEASPDSLQHLFSLDPLKWTDEDVEKIAKELWAKQELWAKTDAEQQKKPKGSRTTKIAATPEALADIMSSLIGKGKK